MQIVGLSSIYIYNLSYSTYNMLRIISGAELKNFVWGGQFIILINILVSKNPSRRLHTHMYEKKYLF